MPRSTIWVLPDDSAPLRHVVGAYERERGPVETVYWMEGPHGSRHYGRGLSLPTRGRGYAMSVKAITPRLAVDLARSAAQDVVVLELDLATMYALASKVVRPQRRVVALIEGDVAMLGPTGSAPWKMAFRRALARAVDGFVANNAHATRYLTDTLGVPRERIVEGWWLAGMPDDLAAVPPPDDVLARREGPTFIGVGQLIPRKGHAGLIRAAARYRDEHGPCQLWILGEGPQRAALEELVSRLDMQQHVVLFGSVDMPRVRGALEAADLFVFPTFNDLVGRALIEALSVGLPSVVSRRSGAIGTLLQDGRNCIVVDPEDPEEVYRGMAVAADPDALARLQAGAKEIAPVVSVDAAVRAIGRAVDGW